MHVPDEMPAVRGPLDIAYAALVTAANADDAATAVESPDAVRGSSTPLPRRD
jgi:hypothetical protein